MERVERYECADCGELLSSDARSCPTCGSSKRRVFVVARDTVQAFSEIIEEARDQLGKIKHESAPRTKRAGKL
jgi:DNA-directed RNA polymerase subunit RPC12/RpoP